MTAKISRAKSKVPAVTTPAKPSAKRPVAPLPSAITAAPTKAIKPAAKGKTKALAPAATAVGLPSGAQDGHSKQARLIAMLQRAPGATIDQMMALTGWQAHTVRGTISGVLRKKLGLNVNCQPSKDAGPRLYRIREPGVGA